MKATAIRDRLARVLGTGADMHVDGDRIRVAARSDAECAGILRTASRYGWKVRVTAAETNGLTTDAPAHVVLTTEKLNKITEIEPADMFATAEAGATTTALHERLGEAGMWLAADPPARQPTIGGVTATGASGSIETGFGPVRDQILGLTVVTPMGRTVVGGGRVVKNVAGYDIPKLIIGSFGAFGVVTQVHLRLRVAPQADLTSISQGNRTEALRMKRDVEKSTIGPAALELRRSPSGGWTVAARLLGSAGAVERGGNYLSGEIGGTWSRLDSAAAADFWNAGRISNERGPVTIRLGPNHSKLQWTLDRLLDEFRNGTTTVSGVRNTVRWSGDTDHDSIRWLRRTVAGCSIPLTVEHAPWPLLASEGHFGEVRPGVGQLVASLRSVFDPEATMVVPLEPTWRAEE